MKRAKNDDSIECLTFDMEKTLPLPRIPANIMFYKRQLWMYNCGIHGEKNNKGHCYKKESPCSGKIEYFLETREIEHMITNIKVDTKKEKVSWLQTREILLQKEKPFSIFLRKSFSGEFSRIDIHKRQTGRPSTTFLQTLSDPWSNGKPISAPKLEDLPSVMDLIPGDARDFYSALIGDSNVDDDVDGFSGVPDFECE
ncbi:hypothetical protein PR048_028873 [Dryococelus australis]|uniref:Uncharacterized protein n=1 Tax=Dryococelus australis TaxID=614101 RepID=A0ABQ9GFG9_9NEOP|nr:hypothetical protein PR048_028873 [Dryococelus australis]